MKTLDLLEIERRAHKMRAEEFKKMMNYIISAVKNLSMKIWMFLHNSHKTE